MSKFASITSGLLVRKGEARPWHQEMMSEPPAWRAEPPSLAAVSPPPPPGDKDRSCAVRMSARDYERLGILAVKRGVTRQQLLKDAVAQLLASQAKVLGCACLDSKNQGACDKTCG